MKSLILKIFFVYSIKKLDEELIQNEVDAENFLKSLEKTDSDPRVRIGKILN